MKLSVWLMPAAKDGPRLRALIQRYASAVGSPVFPPHVTLCTGPVAIAPAGSALTPQPTRVVTLAAPSFGNDYFHGCYLELQHDAGVRALQARCAVALQGTVPEKYPPHLSLSYGILTSEQREAALTLAAPLPLSAELDHIEIWDTSGPVSSWRMQQKL